MVQLGCRLRHAVPKKSFLTERLLSFEYKVRYPPEFLGDNRERLRFTVFTYHLLVHPLGGFVFAKEKDSRLAEGPFEMSVSNFVVSSFHPLAGGFVRTFHQTGVGNEIADTRESSDVVDLVKDYKSKDWTDSGDGAQQMESNRIMILGLALDLRLQVEKDPVIRVEKVQIRFNARACAGVGKKILDPDSIFG